MFSVVCCLDVVRVTVQDNIVLFVVCMTMNSAIIRTSKADALRPALSDDIHDEGMTHPRDMVVFHSGRHLFIAELQCVRGASLDRLQDAKWQATDRDIQWLLVTKPRLLVTSSIPSHTLCNNDNWSGSVRERSVRCLC